MSDEVSPEPSRLVGLRNTPSPFCYPLRQCGDKYSAPFGRSVLYKPRPCSWACGARPCFYPTGLRALTETKPDGWGGGTLRASVSGLGVIHPSDAPLSGWGHDHFRVRRDTTGIIETDDAAGMPFETWGD